LLSGGISRVGGTDLTPYTAVLEELGVTVIDTSAIGSGDPLGHNAYADSPEIVRLLAQRLGGRSVTAGEAKFSDRVASPPVYDRPVRKTTPAAVDSNEARKLLKREPVTSIGQIVDGQISY
jgi:hypothetical protein